MAEMCEDDEGLDSLRAGADDERCGETGERLRDDSMPDVIDRLVAAMNAHDLDGASGLIDVNYRSEQPAHPGRAFVGRAQMRANWEAMFAGIPDFRAEVRRSVRDGNSVWSEWRWSGIRSDGQIFEMSGVTIFEIAADRIVAGRLYLEEVERDDTGVEQTVESLAGQRPRQV